MNNLLICTQEINQNSTTLGFMTSWVRELSKHYDKVLVICLYLGEHKLPSNVEVLSLGKESSKSRFKYIINFYKIIFSRRKEYDKVFIHMNDEYGLLAGFFWKIMGKKVALWSNHYYGTWKRDLVGKFCDKVFYTSKFSYTANARKFPQAVQMPVGVDVSNFKENSKVERKPNSILFLARLDPSKKPEIVLRSLKNLQDRNIFFKATFVGGANKDVFADYEKGIHTLSRDLGLENVVEFVGPVSSIETPRFFLSHMFYVNVAKSGMLDKAIFESVVGGCLPLSTSVDFNDMIYPVVGHFCKVDESSVESLTKKLSDALSLTDTEIDSKAREIQKSVLPNHNLEYLAKRISEEL
jgi:glycosyltransferase involved in cell wall biosynthesis